ncbi:MAG: hypothetical protein KUG77_01340, partial [Nannocystaceae bacterium]|nr:hypothetical protein [Nannocystaceae bacterium]
SQPLALSFSQDRLWLASQVDPDSSQYSLPLCAKIVGRLDVPALRAAFAALVRRHETLRTTFALGPDGKAIQVVHQSGGPVFALREAGSDPEAQAIIERLIGQALDIEKGPVFAADLMRTGREQAFLLLRIHHIACDGWSLQILIRDLVQLYEREAGYALSQPEIPELEIQYADYAAHQRAWVDSPALGRELDYWGARLSRPPSSLRLPGDARPGRGPGSSSKLEADSLLHVLSEQARAGLRRVARECGATTYAVGLAAFCLLVERLCGQQEFIVGTPVANRLDSSTHDLVGFFVNTLPIRVDLSRSKNFRELVLQTRELVASAHEHQRAPFALVAEAAGSGQPLFRVWFAFHEDQEASGKIGEARWSLHPVDHDANLFDLTLSMSNQSDAMTAKLEFGAHHWSTDAMAAHVGAWDETVKQATEQPDASLRGRTPGERGPHDLDQPSFSFEALGDPT